MDHLYLRFSGRGTQAACQCPGESCFEHLHFCCRLCFERPRQSNKTSSPIYQQFDKSKLCALRLAGLASFSEMPCVQATGFN